MHPLLEEYISDLNSRLSALPKVRPLQAMVAVMGLWLVFYLTGSVADGLFGSQQLAAHRFPALLPYLTSNNSSFLANKLQVSRYCVLFVKYLRYGQIKQRVKQALPSA